MRYELWVSHPFSFIRAFPSLAEAFERVCNEAPTREMALIWRLDGNCGEMASGSVLRERARQWREEDSNLP